MNILAFVKREKTVTTLIIIGVSLIFLGLFFFVWNSNFNKNEEIDAAKVGQFGDFVGGVVGSIWALAGVILFYLALTEQRQDFKTNGKTLDLQVKALNQQIEEFRLQRTELENSRKIYEEQNKTQMVQQFESNFYSLLNVYSTIKNTLNNLDANKDYFKTQCETLKGNYTPNCNIIDHHNFMVSKYLILFNNQRGHLSHYFKTFYRIIKIIDSNSFFTEKEKVFYAKIIRSQLTDYEQILVYYNSHTVYGTKSTPLLLKYNLLKHNPIFNKPEFEYFYSKQKNSDIILFAEWLSSFLTLHINKSYEMEWENEKIEEKFTLFNCIVGVDFSVSNEIAFQVICNNDISKNNINLSEGDFIEFLKCFLFEKILFSTYLNPSKVEIVSYQTNMEHDKIFGMKIKTAEKLSLNYDKY